MCSVGIVDGEPQRKVAHDPHLAKRLRYSPQRRGVMVQIGNTLICMNQNGKYRQAYLEYKMREKTKAVDDGLIVVSGSSLKKMSVAEKNNCRSVAHIHKRARLHMVKDLLRDFWLEWKATRMGLLPSAPLSPSRRKTAN